MTNHLSKLLVILGVFLPLACVNAGEKLDLNGTWQFRMDPKDTGKAEQWYSAGTIYDMTMPVPGAWNAGGAGAESHNLFHSFQGPAWYHRKVSIPATWRGKVIWLKFGGVHRYADVWVNGQFVGNHIAYITPFKFDITRHIGNDLSADIAVRVDGRQNPEIDPLFGCMDVMDAGELSWGGMYRGVKLEATADSWIESVRAVPRIASSSVEITTEIGSRDSAQSAPTAVAVEVYDANGNRVGGGKAPIGPGSTAITLSVRVPRAKLWSPRQPYLYTVKSKLMKGSTQLDALSDRFGMREIGTAGKNFVLNGKPIFLRGYGDDCVFPNTVAPPADKREYYRRFKMAKDYGFNYVRHHSWFPLAEYFEVADELGIMLQPEFPIAYDNYYDESTPEKRQLYLDAWREIIEANWNHPSIITWCMGNELGGGHELSREMYRMAKKIDPTRLVIDTDGLDIPSPGDKMRPTLDFLTPLFDELRLFGLNDNKYPSDLKPAKPILAHEMCNFATLPSLSQIELFGNGIRPHWLYALRDLVTKEGLESGYPAWVANSNKLQSVALKTNFEAARRSPDISGYHQWLFQDYWNGSNGVVDMFYRPKGASAAEFRKFNSPTVLLMDCPRRSFRSGETAKIKLLVSRYEDGPSQNAALKWRLSAGGKVLATGREQGLRVKSTGVQGLRTVDLKMPKATVVRKLTLAVELTDKNGKTANDWNLWVYPTDRLKPGKQIISVAGSPRTGKLYPWMRDAEGKTELSGCNLLITSQLTPERLDYLERGGRVLLLSADGVFPATPSSYRPCWWLGDVRADSNTGTVVDTAHPAVSTVPNEGWLDLNFANLLIGSRAMLLNELPVKIQPIIRCLDVHGALRHKAYLFEANVGRGKLLASSLNFGSSLYKKDPAAVFLLDRLIRYASGPSFSPVANLPADYLRKRVAPIPEPKSARQPESALRVNGFAKITSNTGEEMFYRNHRDPSARAWVARQTDGTQRLEWVSAPIKIAKPGRISLVWTAATGYISEPEGSFTLHLNGKPLLDFGVTRETRRWTSADGKADLFFDVKSHDNEDALGVMYLTLPTEMLQDRAPARLAVSGSNSSSRRWFTVFDYADTVEYED